MCWLYMALTTYPVFFPIMAMEYGINGGTIGLVLALPALISLLCIPLLNRYITKIGIEEAIVYSGILFAIGMFLMACCSFCTT